MKRQHMYALLLGNGLITAAALAVLLGNAPAGNAFKPSAVAPAQHWSMTADANSRPVARMVSTDATTRPAPPTWIF